MQGKIALYFVCLATVTGLAVNPANAQPVTIGVTVGATGPTASIGIPMKNGIELLPQKIGDIPLKYVILDDVGDPGVAVKNMRQLTERDNVDIVLGVDFHSLLHSFVRDCGADEDTADLPDARQDKFIHFCRRPTC